MALSPEHPDNAMAQQMIAVYGPSPGLNEPANLVGAVEAHLAATKKPTATDYETYAVAATLANQARKAGLATDKAKALAAAGKKGTGPQEGDHPGRCGDCRAPTAARRRRFDRAAGRFRIATLFPSVLRAVSSIGRAGAS